MLVIAVLLRAVLLMLPLVIRRADKTAKSGEATNATMVSLVIGACLATLEMEEAKVA